MYFHTFVQWASDWGWIEQTLNSRRSPPETEVFFFLLLLLHKVGTVRMHWLVGQYSKPKLLMVWVCNYARLLEASVAI